MAELDPISAAFAAIETRLRTYFLPRVWEFAIVPDPLSVEEFKRLVRKTPLLALGWRQLNPSKAVGRRFQGDLGLRLTIVVRNPLEGGQRFLGDARGPGLFPAMSGAIALLNGFTHPDLGTVFVTAAAQAYADGYADHDIAIATLDLGVLVTIGDVTGAGEAAPDFLKLLSEFEPWPDGHERDEPVEVRPA
jgi:hypothetical protein